MRRHVRMAGLAAVALLAASCASSSSTESTGVADDAAATSGSAATTEGAPSNDPNRTLVAPLLGGGTFDLAVELESEPVAMWFWAPG